MPCPHSESGPPRGGIGRRDFVKSALAIGGASALSACVSRQGRSQVANGPSDPSTLTDRLFTWNRFLPTGPNENPKIPGHQLILLLNLREEGPPSESARETVAAAFRTLERAYQWGAGTGVNPRAVDGLLYLVGYSRSYFDRFDESLPEEVGLQRPEAVIDRLGEEAHADQYDAAVCLMSDEVQVLLAAEQALKGEFDELNGVSVEGSLDGVFEFADRRTGFLGVGRPAEEFDVPELPEESPTAMGFRSSFRDNQAGEDQVAIDEGPFADGSTMQLSRIDFDLDHWYDNEKDRRIHQMFGPSYTEAGVGKIGEKLAGHSHVTRSDVERAPEDAAEKELVGHTQKVAHARSDGFDPVILRRSEGVSTDREDPSMNFLSLQHDIGDFVATREAMNGTHIEADVPAENDGIRDYIDVVSRATLLVPPRALQALPEPRP